jgi:hypothetical protein
MRIRETPKIQPPALTKLLETVEWLDFLEPNMSQLSTYARSATNKNTYHSKHDADKLSSLQDGGCRTKTLDLPAWVPPAVKERVFNIYTNECVQSVGAADRLDLLLRLASDGRMKGVWAELYKQRQPKKDTKQFVYSPRFRRIGCAKAWRWKAAELRIASDVSPETIERLRQKLAWSINVPEEPIDPQERQDLAAQYFFHHSYLSALVNSPPMTQSEIKNRLEERKSCSGRLRTEADKLRSFGMEEEADNLVAIALQCERDISFAFNRWTIGRQRTDNRLRAYVFTLAKLNNILFGTPMYGTLATIANVVFNGTNKITGPHIHEMLRGPRPRILTSGQRLRLSGA